jgi:hypothetical protein
MLAKHARMLLMNAKDGPARSRALATRCDSPERARVCDESGAGEVDHRRRSASARGNWRMHRAFR